MDAFRVRFINKTIQGLLLFLFTMNVGAGLYMPFLAIFVTKNIAGATLATVGLLLALAAITKSIIQLPLAKWLDSRAGEKDDYYVILFGTSLVTIYLFGFLFVHSVGGLALLQIIVGMGDAMIFSAYYAVFSHHIDKDSEGFEWSMLSVGGLTISVAIGTFLGGVVAGKFGFETLFISAGLINTTAIIFLLLLYPHMNIMRKPHHYKTVVHQDRKPRV